MKIKICFISSLLIFSITLFSQELKLKDYQKELGLKISDSDTRKMVKAVEEVIEGTKQAEEAFNFFNNLEEKEKNSWKSSGHKKSLKMIGDASEKIKEAHHVIFDTYQEYVDGFWESHSDKGHYAAGMNKAKYYERMANKSKSTALTRREQVANADNFPRARVKYEQAMELEKLMIRDKGRALQIYQDFPVEYDYGWTDDVDAETVARAFADKYVVEPDEETTVTITESKTDTVVLTQVDTVYIIQEGESVNDADNAKWLPDVEFKVQIAAHIKPISDAQIKALYKGSERVNVVFEDNWYKYQMGPYANYTNAKKVLNACNVPKAFIVPYREGKKLTIKEALKETEQAN